MLSPDTDHVSPNALPKEACSKINTNPTASAKRTQIPKRTTSQKHCGNQFVKLTKEFLLSYFFSFSF